MPRLLKLQVLKNTFQQHQLQLVSPMMNYAQHLQD